MEHAGESLRIAVGGESYAANLFHPADEPAPAILIVPEMYGVNGYINAVARDYAASGFLTLVMDVLWRVDPELVLSYTGPDSDRAHEIHDDFDLEAGVLDMQAGIDRLRSMSECNGKVGVVGFCLGGTMAYLAALKTSTDAAVDYYGSRAVEYTVEAAMVSTPLQLHTGANDTAFPPGAFAALETAIRKNGFIESFVYPNARHAFANDLRADRYNAEGTGIARERTFAFFDEHLRTLRP